MEQRLYIISLYDIYGELLTPKQRECFEEYYFNNLSLSEISENNNVSRNAIHKQLKDCEEKLYNYEEKLNIYDKNKKIKEFSNNLDNELKEKLLNLL